MCAAGSASAKVPVGSLAGLGVAPQPSFGQAGVDGPGASRDAQRQGRESAGGRRQSPEPGKGGEIQITDALMKQAQNGCVIAYKFKGKRFDCGGAEGYIEATNFCFENFYKTGKAY